ncbi:MAG: 30S ribosomal protein S4e [Candidatus Bathyarchaeota archaeon BA2]|nr:MAG: 30S ribosomal protein S4e [Candidatus Bathyarchaeota archaeon BA2]
MGKKGGKKHLKRKPAPKFWPIHRKEAVWTVKPKPGPHPLSRCIPLTLVIRAILKFAKTRKEAKTIISQGKIKVNEKVQREELFPTGLMDVISIPDPEKTYRVLPSEKGLILHPIGTDEADFKLCRIENKTVVRSGHVQLNLHDGRSMLIRVDDPKKPEEDVYQTLDTLKLSIPEQEFMAHMKLTVGAPAIIIGGKNVGKCGKITAIEEKPSLKRRDLLVTIEDKNGNRFQTTLNFIFVLGETEPSISLPEVD